MIQRTHHVPQAIQSGVQARVAPASANQSFQAAVANLLQSTASSSQSTGNTSPAPAAPMVIQSPFNPLGLPVSTTPAPTAAEVAADPLKYAGTAFDPARYIQWNFAPRG